MSTRAVRCGRLQGIARDHQVDRYVSSSLFQIMQCEIRPADTSHWKDSHPMDQEAAGLRDHYTRVAGWDALTRPPTWRVLREFRYDFRHPITDRFSSMSAVEVCYLPYGMFRTLAHAYHYVRARCVGCPEVAELLRETEDPVEMIETARRFVEEQASDALASWEAHGNDLRLLRSLYLNKFTDETTQQNRTANKELDYTGKAYLLHTSPCPLLGIGMRPSEYAARENLDPRLIPGRNWEGLLLMEARTYRWTRYHMDALQGPRRLQQEEQERRLWDEFERDIQERHAHNPNPPPEDSEPEEEAEESEPEESESEESEPGEEDPPAMDPAADHHQRKEPTCEAEALWQSIGLTYERWVGMSVKEPAAENQVLAPAPEAPQEAPGPITAPPRAAAMEDKENTPQRKTETRKRRLFTQQAPSSAPGPLHIQVDPDQDKQEGFIGRVLRNVYNACPPASFKRPRTE